MLATCGSVGQLDSWLKLDIDLKGDSLNCGDKKSVYKKTDFKVH